MAPDNRFWLNNNLGADYSNINSAHFNLAQQATSPTDYKAYGSSFQFGRDGDGHELINWTSSTRGAWAYPAASWKRHTELSYTKVNDPCPIGWHTPTANELLALQSTIIGRGTNHAEVIASSVMYNNTTMRFTAYGFRYPDNPNALHLDSFGDYWSSTKSPTHDTHAYYIYISRLASLTHTYASIRNMDAYITPYGMAIRCIID